MQPPASNRTALITLTTVFFFWGFVAASNTVLIPFFKANFTLAQWQSQLVEMAFYAAYFFGSLTYFLYAITMGDLLNRIGYKRGLLGGFGLSALGAAMFVPAAAASSYPLLLAGLFVIGLGFTLQQIVANPYMIAIGDPATGAQRVNLAQGINSFGTMIGPLLLNWVLFGNINSNETPPVSVVQTPYLVLTFCLIVFAVILGRTHLPTLQSETIRRDVGALKFPQVRWGMLAIFIYVGVEVSIQSNLPSLMAEPHMLGLPYTSTVHYISLYWGSLMIGRWTGAIGAITTNRRTIYLLTFVVPLLAFGVIIFVNWIKGSPIQDFLMYVPFILLAIGGFYLGRDKPAHSFLIFSIIGAVMMLAGLYLDGKWAVLAFVSGGLFCSIMWPCIFTLAISGLGSYTAQGSSLLVMMILGGAIIPPLQGYVSDLTNIHSSYWIPVVCFSLLACIAWNLRRVLSRQGIHL